MDLFGKFKKHKLTKEEEKILSETEHMHGWIGVDTRNFKKD